MPGTFRTLLIAWMLGALPWSTTAHARNEVCDRVLERVAKNKFTTTRDLEDHFTLFGRDFVRRLRGLGPRDRWGDIGSGFEIPQIEYKTGLLPLDFRSLLRGIFDVDDFAEFRPASRAQLVSVAYARPEINEFVTRSQLATLYRAQEMRSAIPEGHHRQHYDRLIEEIPAEDIGPLDLLTDYYGPLSYSLRPHEVLKTYFDLLKPEAPVFFYLDRRRLRFLPPGSDADISLVQWIQSIEGIRVQECESLFHPGRATGAYLITRVPGAEIRVPPLRIVEIRDDTPPHIKFRLQDDAT